MEDFHKCIVLLMLICFYGANEWRLYKDNRKK